MAIIIPALLSKLNSFSFSKESPTEKLICDLSREKGPYAEIINFEKTAFFEMLQKFVDFYIYAYLRSTTIALQVDVFVFARNVLVHETWPRKHR